jgi:dihydrofolate reductase
MLSIIAAINDNYVIGKENKMLWNIQSDLKRFKNLTTGKTIVMGRKTFESLPGILPNRKHIVITKNKDYSIESKDVIIIKDISEIIKLKNLSEEIFIIGGGEIYLQFLPFCRRLYITKVRDRQKGDAYFPKFNMNEYKVIEKQTVNEKSVQYSFFVLEKKIGILSDDYHP